ncbi:pro-sigmaK processing inhibitor BofA family protein [Candidatus Micrarchaeota archaeon]|nr:pro-sigmaK processing inhibitor BofA family protein [Candidatus Micrarchaeota archaeon]
MAINEIASKPAIDVAESVAFSGADLIIIAGVVIILALIVLFIFRRFLINSVIGIIALIVLNYAGVEIPLNVATIVVTAILGLVGVALLIILKLSGIAF